MQSTKEKEEMEQQKEILNLLSKPTAREQSLMDTFRSQDGCGVKEFCSFPTKSECMKIHAARVPCSKLHFVKILQQHTDESLGDCSFLNTCFHMDTCKYIHYEVDKADVRLARKRAGLAGGVAMAGVLESTKLIPPQWIQCDLRNLNLAVLGKFSVITAVVESYNDKMSYYAFMDLTEFLVFAKAWAGLDHKLDIMYAKKDFTQ